MSCSRWLSFIVSGASVALLSAVSGCSGTPSPGRSYTGGGLIFGPEENPASLQQGTRLHALDGDDDDDDGYGDDGSTAAAIGDAAQVAAEGITNPDTGQPLDGTGVNQIARDAAMSAADQGADPYGQAEAAISAMSEEISREVAEGHASAATAAAAAAALSSAVRAAVSIY